MISNIQDTYTSKIKHTFPLKEHIEMPNSISFFTMLIGNFEVFIYKGLRAHIVKNNKIC